MKLQLNCGICMINTALTAMEAHAIDPAQQVTVVEKLIKDTPAFLDEPTPAEFHSRLLHNLAGYLSIEDLYAEAKQQHNAHAMELAPYIHEQIQKSADPLFAATQAAAAGNMIDLTFSATLDLNAALSRIFTDPFIINHYDQFLQRLPKVRTIVFIADNAGEIVFDRLFIEQCVAWRAQHGYGPTNVTTVVKGKPILNDATRADAEQIGLAEVSAILDSGANILGLPLSRTREEVRQALDQADLIISKGQANFETLEEEKAYYGKIFFLLKAKCLHVSAYLNVKLGSSVFYFPE